MYVKTKSSLSTVCSLCLFGSSAFSVVLLYSHKTFLESVFAQVWFMSVCYASGLCAFVFCYPKVSRKNYELQEVSNWWCGAVGLPCLAAQIMIHNGSQFLLSVGHIVWACAMVAFKFNEKSNWIPASNLDVNKMGMITASLAALEIAVSCYSHGNLYGILGSVFLIFSHAILSTKIRLDDMTSLDAFLICMSVSNYFFALSI